MGIPAWVGVTILTCAAAGKLFSLVAFGSYLIELLHHRRAGFLVWPIVLAEFVTACALACSEVLNSADLRLLSAALFVLISAAFVATQIVGAKYGLGACRCFGQMDLRLSKGASLGRSIAVFALSTVTLFCATLSPVRAAVDEPFPELVVGALTGTTLLVMVRIVSDFVVFERWERGVVELYEIARIRRMEEEA